MSDPRPIPAPSPPESAASTPATESDMVAALRFSHMLEMQTKVRLVELQASFDALLEVVAPEGTAARKAFDERRPSILAREQQQAGREVLVAIDTTPDKYQLTDLPRIDCASLIPICKARCCTLVFALSGQDLDEGVIRWSYGRPYQIRRRSDGYCVHNEDGTHGCGAHAQRPAVCRQYDCRNDPRIWTDFEKRILAPAPERKTP
jgi:Fe-S-cluster containining protein